MCLIPDVHTQKSILRRLSDSAQRWCLPTRARGSWASGRVSLRSRRKLHWRREEQTNEGRESQRVTKAWAFPLPARPFPLHAYGFSWVVLFSSGVWASSSNRKRTGSCVWRPLAQKPTPLPWSICPSPGQSDEDRCALGGPAASPAPPGAGLQGLPFLVRVLQVTGTPHTP